MILAYAVATASLKVPATATVTSLMSVGGFECGGNGDMMEDCCETELTWNQELSDYTVECSEDLPSSCDEFAMDIEAVNECDGSTYEAYCLNFLNDSNDPLCVAAATTAKRDASLSEGEYDATDAALRVYGLSVIGGSGQRLFCRGPQCTSLLYVLFGHRQCTA